MNSLELIKLYQKDAFIKSLSYWLNDDKQKVKVVISIFGRPTPVELDYFQVEMEK